MKVLSIGSNRPVNLSLGEHVNAFKTALSEIKDAGFATRLWGKDPTLWREEGVECELIKDSLGWLSVPGPMRTKVAELTTFADGIKGEGYTNVVVLGMGGSSLAPEVMAQIFGQREGYPKLTVLDSTDPEAVGRVTKLIEPAKTLFVVSSKSGTTIEPLSSLDYFYALVSSEKSERAGENFIAITDEGSTLVSLAQKLNFRKVFLNPGDIGGRYSALSYFGLVPAVLSGIDIDALLASALQEAEDSGEGADLSKNPAIFLGAALGSLFREGRDKITFIMSEELQPFGLWLSQLLAESTGKDRVGLVPIVGEPIGGVEDYAKDRVFVHIGTGFLEEHVIELLYYLEQAGHPIISVRLDDLHDLGGEFLRWEIATATAGFVMGINPFDQPDVETAKKLTLSFLESISMSAGGGFQGGIVIKGENLNISLGDSTLERIPSRRRKYVGASAIEDFLALVKEGDYISLLSYADSENRAINGMLTGLRFILRNKTKAATQLGYGPRYLHSTGQLHKGGSDNGVFFMVLRAKPGEGEENITIPEKDYTFYDLESAQANGDLGALQAKGRRVAFIEVKTTFEAAMNELHSLIVSPPTPRN
ncbi:MAG: glucose-6-phosphate isomerase [Thermodesulfobacteriota bacterium]